MNRAFSKLKVKSISAVSKVGGPSFKKKVEDLVKAKDLGQRVINAFTHFINYEWAFDVNVANQMMMEMDREERDMFDMDFNYIHWRLWMYEYIHGLKRYTLVNEANDEPLGPNMFNHLMWPLKEH